MGLLSKLIHIPNLLYGGWGILIRIGLIALLCVGIWSWGAMWGYQHEEAKLDVFTAQTKLIGDQAAKRNAELKAKYEANHEHIKEAYAHDLQDIQRWHNAHPRIVLRDNSGGVATPATSSCPKGDDAGAGESFLAGTSEEGFTTVTNEFIRGCIIDAAHVEAFQAYIRDNNLPVEE